MLCPSRKKSSLNLPSPCLSSSNATKEQARITLSVSMFARATVYVSRRGEKEESLIVKLLLLYTRALTHHKLSGTSLTLFATSYPTQFWSLVHRRASAKKCRPFVLSSCVRLCRRSTKRAKLVRSAIWENLYSIYLTDGREWFSDIRALRGMLVRREALEIIAIYLQS